MSRRHLISFIVFFISSVSWASLEGQQELLKQSLRPTAQEFLEKMAPMPDTNPFFNHPDRLHARGYRAADSKIAPTLPALAVLIANLEFAFPGAIWAPIGRDYVMTTDAMDLFYTSIGQPGRVRRLNVSTPSFTGNMQDTVDFLETFGLNFDPRATPPPVVAMDYTGYNPTSQSTQLMTAGYSEFKRRGGDLKKFLYRFQIVNFGGSNQRGTLLQLNPKQFFKEQEATVDQLLRPQSPLSVNSGANIGSAEWHAPWGRFTRLIDGSVTTTPSFDHPQMHADVLAQFYEVYKAVSAPEFLHMVQAECRKLGFEFSVNLKDLEQNQKLFEEHQAALKLEAMKELEIKKGAFFVKIHSSLSSVMQSLSPMVIELRPQLRPQPPSQLPLGKAPKRPYLTANAQKLRDWLDQEKANFDQLFPTEEQARFNAVSLSFIQAVSMLVDRKLIDRKDYRRLLAPALSRSTTDEEFFSFVSRVLGSSSELARSLRNHEEFYLTVFAKKQRPGTENTAVAYQALQGRFPALLTPTCDDAFTVSTEQEQD